MSGPLSRCSPTDHSAAEQTGADPDDGLSGMDDGPAGAGVDDECAGPQGEVLDAMTIDDDSPYWVTRFAALTLTGLALLLVLVALLAPNDLSRLTPGAFARIPLEGLFGLTLVLLLPRVAGRVVAALGGLALGLLTVVKLIDTGAYTVLSRPFNLVLDWGFLDQGLAFVSTSVGRSGAIGLVVAIAMLAFGVPVLLVWSTLRLSRLAAADRAAATGAVAALTIVWLTSSLLGAHLVPGQPVASRSAALFSVDRADKIRSSLHDHQAFAREAAVDAFRDTPGDQLLTGLHGKDVVLAFVESYGRSAIEDPEMAPTVDAVLDAGTERLRSAGYDSRSGFLTSPTTGGQSVLAHATLLSGLWIDNRPRYKSLTTSSRFTLNQAFQRANWRSVGVVPGVTQTWPEGGYFGYDKIYQAKDLGYRGPKFGWATMTDQYVLSAFERAEHSPDHTPIFAEIPLISSHIPWAPVPSMVDWDEVGNGSVFAPMVAAGRQPDDVWSDSAQIRTEYHRSIEYTLSALISYVEKYGDQDLVMIFLGDHQPVELVTGREAGRDVPITIVAKDPAVLEQISDWGWTPGLNPASTAPAWPMSDFRDRFLTAFGSWSSGG